jgi:hypothetical protein
MGIGHSHPHLAKGATPKRPNGGGQGEMLEVNKFSIFGLYSPINSIDQPLDLWDPPLTYVGFT